MSVSIDILKSLPYYSGLGPTELDSIQRVMFEKSAGRGEIFLLDGEASEVLFFVISGVVKVFKASASGKEQILSMVRPGGTLNDVPIFDGGPNHVSAQAMTPVLLYSIEKSDLLNIMREHPQVALNVIKVLGKQMRHLILLIEDLSFKNVLGRVAKILLEPGRDGDSSRPRLTQQDMAAMAGTAREMVGRSLKTLENEGIIRMDRNRIVITDKKALEQIADIN